MVCPTKDQIEDKMANKQYSLSNPSHIFLLCLNTLTEQLFFGEHLARTVLTTAPSPIFSHKVDRSWWWCRGLWLEEGVKTFFNSKLSRAGCIYLSIESSSECIFSDSVNNYPIPPPSSSPIKAARSDQPTSGKLGQIRVCYKKRKSKSNY